MDWTFCSREFERDYTWDNTHASHPVAEYSQGFFAPAFEGSLTTSRFAAILRCPGSPQGVMLCVSVSTSRIDFRNRPIRTMAFLRAEEPEETKLLAAFFAECLCKPDSETLYNSKSGVARAVESLYQTKKPDTFFAFCKKLTPDTASGRATTGRWEIPRDDKTTRGELAQSLSATIAGGFPFLFALTDRLPTDVLGSLGTMCDKAVIRIFSEATPVAKPIPGPHAEGGPSPRSVAAAIGGAAILAVILLVAAVRSCGTTGADQHGGRGAGTNAPPVGPRGPTNVVDVERFGTNAPASEAVCHTNAVSPRGTNEVIRAINSGNSGTNAPPSSAISPTNAVTSQGRSGESEPPIQGMD